MHTSQYGVDTEKSSANYFHVSEFRLHSLHFNITVCLLLLALKYGIMAHIRAKREPERTRERLKCAVPYEVANSDADGNNNDCNVAARNKIRV